MYLEDLFKKLQGLTFDGQQAFIEFINYALQFYDNKCELFGEEEAVRMLNDIMNEYIEKSNGDNSFKKVL